MSLNKVLDFFRRNPILMVALVIVVNFVLRIIHADASSIYLDEGQTMFQVNRSIPEIIEDYVKKQQNAPLYFILLHFWVKVFGLSIFTVRSFSVLMMSLTGGMFFLLARRIVSLEFAIAASLLFLGVNEVMNFAHEARGYATISFLAVSSFYALSHLLHKPKINWAIALFGFNTALLYTHYLTIYIFPVQAIIALIWWPLGKQKRGFLFYAASQLAVVFVFAPWLKVVFEVMPEKGSFWIPDPTWGLLKNFYYYLVKGISKTHYSFMILGAALIWYFIRIKKQEKEDHIILIGLLLWAFAPVLANYFVGFHIPVFIAKYTFYASFGFILFFTWAIFKLPLGKWIRWAFVLYCCFLNFKVLQWESPKMENWKDAVEYLKQHERPEKSIVFSQAYYTYKAFLPYYDIDLFKNNPRPFETAEQQDIYFKDRKSQLQDLIGKKDPDEVILIRSHWRGADPNGETKAFLDENWTLKEERTDFSGVHVHIYEKPNSNPDEADS